MENEWLSLKEIAYNTGIPEQTCRRYAEHFKHYVIFKEFGRTKKYSSQSTEIFLLVNSLYKQGKKTEEILEILSTSRRQNLVHEEETLLPQPVQVLQSFVNTLAQELEKQNQLLGQILIELKEMRTERQKENWLIRAWNFLRDKIRILFQEGGEAEK